MKYVLVIDVDEPMESEDVRIDYLCYYHCGDDIESEYGAMLKPLPKKKNECYYYGELAKNEFAVGYNACLEEIMGETK